MKINKIKNTSPFKSQGVYVTTQENEAADLKFVEETLNLVWIPTPDDGNCGLYPWLAAISVTRGQEYPGGMPQLRRDVSDEARRLGPSFELTVDGGTSTAGAYFFPFNRRSFDEYLTDMSEPWMAGGSTANYVDALFHLFAGKAK